MMRLTDRLVRVIWASGSPHESPVTRRALIIDRLSDIARHTTPIEYWLWLGVESPSAFLQRRGVDGGLDVLATLLEDDAWWRVLSSVPHGRGAIALMELYEDRSAGTIRPGLRDVFEKQRSRLVRSATALQASRQDPCRSS